MLTAKQKARVDLALKFLSVLSDKTQTLNSIATKLGKTHSELYRIHQRMLSANVVETTVGNKPGVRLVSGVDISEPRVRDILGYKERPVETLHECLHCGELEPRIRATSRNGTLCFVDRQGRRWEKGACPDCAAVLRQVVLEEPMTSRKCRGCGECLPVSRYFDCYTCKPTLPKDISEESLYFGSSSVFEDESIEDMVFHTEGSDEDY